jgi:hypothetical protein
MPITDDYDAIAKRMRELELPVQAQSHKDAELLEKWRAAALDTARTYVQKRRRELAMGPTLRRRPRPTDWTEESPETKTQNAVTNPRIRARSTVVSSSAPSPVQRSDFRNADPIPVPCCLTVARTLTGDIRD